MGCSCIDLGALSRVLNSSVEEAKVEMEQDFFCVFL